MAQRISRAKQRIKARACRSGCRTPEERPARLRTVLHVLYLIFNEGYASSGGATLHRVELSAEAIRLTRMVHRMLPDDAEVAGLLALMLLIDARRPARTDAGGELVPLAEQDRTRWDRRADRRGHRAAGRARSAAARWASTSCRPRSPPCTTGPPGPRTPTGRRSSPCTGCWSG